MLLFIGDRFRCSEQYRLKNYWELCRLLPEYYPPTVFYFTQGNTAVGPTIQEIIAETGEPDYIFLMWPYIGESDFTKLKAKVFTYITDCPTQNDDFIRALMCHKIKFDTVFFNYYKEYDQFNLYFDTKKYVYLPDWASEEYDYDKHGLPKTIEFQVSGNHTAEYIQRFFYKEYLEKAKKTPSANLKAEGLTNDPTGNKLFLEKLMASKWSPHDGGIYNRVVPRFYESSFAKSVIIAPDHGKEFKVNGFKHNENIIITDRGRGVKISVNDKLWRELSPAAHDLIKTRHTTRHRIKKILESVM